MVILRSYYKQAFWFLSLALALYVFCQADPLYTPTYDDTAILMRYLVNFRTGHFLTYNIADGPVYGVTDFWQGLATGVLSWLGLAPLASVMMVSFLFTVVFFYAVLRILHEISDRAEFAIVAGAAFYFSSSFIAQTLFLGLETPLHLFLVATTFLLFFQKRQKLFHLLAVATIISKLDACALVAGLLILNLLRSWQEGEVKKTALTGLAFFLAPLLAWGLVATLLFGSPIPESFLAKFLFYPKAPRTSWFPFLEPMINAPLLLKSMLWAGGGCILAILVAVARREWFSPSLVFVMAFAGTMALYYLHDPLEKMSWYYSLPEFLLLMAVVCAPFDASRLRPWFLGVPATLVAVVVVAVVLDLRLPLNRVAIPADRNWEMYYEAERIASGELANRVAPKVRRVLWTGSGYAAYLFDGYVVDVSGLDFPQIWKVLERTRQPDQATRD